MKALIALENGYFDYGEYFTDPGEAFGEFVFNTSMTGYEEIITDPSYKAQVVVFTYPLIGNYGVTREDGQSDGIKCEAVVVRECSRVTNNYRSRISLPDYLNEGRIPGIRGIDTRALTRQLREKGAVQGGITSRDINPEDFIAEIRQKGSISDKDVFADVINDDVLVFEGKPSGIKIAAFDFGIKQGIIKELQNHFEKIYLIPFDNKYENRLKSLDYDGIFLSNGPGDPRIVKKSDEFIKSIANERIPITAICFGHQLVGKAFDLDIYKLQFGHHGGNHPVKEMKTGKVHITAQNHNYAVSLDAIQNNEVWELSWLNLYDNTVEGIRHKTLPISAIQFHPEAFPGPNEACNPSFREFFELIRDNKNAR